VSRSEVVTRVLAWYAEAARDLPWRRPDASPWSIMVSEFMLQQTPVSRVIGPWQQWMERWPSPTALADAPSGEAVRAWGRLGYPRRALRLHQAATAIRDRHDGEVPDDHAALLALPGVGSYTAAAIASFAFGRRHVVLDTNVRRVQARIAAGVQFPAAATTAAERLLAEEFLPDDPGRAARWAVASMELGALICTARNPRCADCPVRDECSWRERGRPVWDGPPRVGQRYDGTDRQCRGALLAVLRSSDVAVPGDELLAVWRDPAQARRAIDTLTADGLMISVGDDAYALPH
jgi:A/G-specific adenine glycosylase